MARYEVQPTPDLNDELLADDEVWLTYKLWNGGNWVLGWEIGKLEQRFESDQRFALTSYSFDESAGELLLKVRVRRPDEMPEMVYQASVFSPQAIAAIAGLVGIAIGLMLYDEVVQRRKVMRLQKSQAEIRSIMDDPTFPADKKAAIEAAMQSAGVSSDGTTVAEAVVAVGGGMGLVALAVLAWMFFGKNR